LASGVLEADLSKEALRDRRHDLPRRRIDGTGRFVEGATMPIRGALVILPLLLTVASAVNGQESGPGPIAPPSSTTPDGSPPTSPGSGGVDQPRAANVGISPSAEPGSTPPGASTRGPEGLARPNAAVVGIAPRAEPSEKKEPEIRHLSKLLGLEESPVQLYGWIQNSYTATPGFNPRNGSTVTVFPNRLANSWQGNQYYLIVEKVLEGKDEPEFGFRLDTLFGNDWLFTHSFGLFDSIWPYNGFPGLDFPQMYAEVHLPWLFKGGIDIRGGRFYSPSGFESVQAVKRPLLSVPYLLNYTPFTFLGALATFHLNDRLIVTSGAVNGADRWIDSNYHYSFLGGFNWISESKKTTFTTTLLAGPNQLPFFPSTNLGTIDTIPLGVYTNATLQNRRNPYYNRSTLVYLSSVLVHHWNDKLTEAAELAYVTEANVLGLGPGGKAVRAEYYGFAHHFLYEFHEKLTGVFRAEIFRDDDGLATGFATTFSELTLGAIIKPRPDLWIRPEIRYDWAQNVRPYNDGTQSGQLTLAVDAIIQF
jgi:hypothetical protein